jgi:hypothetical protein
MRKRLEELNWQTQAHSLNHGDHGRVVEVFDAKPGEVVTRLPVSLKQKRKQIA